MIKSLRSLLSAGTLAGVLLSCQGTAAELTVTTLSDELDVPAGENLSLREAIRDAVAGDTIKFAPTLNGGTILLTQQTLSIAKNLTIDAMSLEAGITIDGNNTRRVFTTGGTVSMRGLHVRRGLNGIRNQGNLTMEECSVSECSFMDPGAGIFQDSGSLLLKQCSILFNRPQSSGGGGMFINGGTAKLINCTIAENESFGSSGIALGSGATVDLIHCTVANNRSSSSFPGAAIVTTTGTLRLQNSVIAGNTGSGNIPIDLYLGGGTLQKSGQNFISCNVGVTTQFPASSLVGTSAVPLDPMLAALAPHGGRTSYYLPLSGSKLLQAALATADTPAVDQRGLSRVSGSAADLGSVEASASTFFPADEATNTAVAPVLEWSHQHSASQYRVYLGTDPGTLALQGTSPTGRMPLPRLSSGTTYHWRVDSVVSGSTILGPLLSFVTRPTLVVTKAADESPAMLQQEGVSLREAISLANSSPGFDVIQFHPDLAGTPIHIDFGVIDVLSELIVEGDSLPTGTTVTGARLTIQAPTELRSIAFMNGEGVSTSGGTIHVTGALTARNCTIAGNRAGNGGGIYLQSGSCTLIHCTITGNTANFRGGGIYRSGGTLVLENCIVAGNRALEESPDVRVTASSTSRGRNLIGNNSGSEAMFPASSWVGTQIAPLNAGLAPAGTHVSGKSHHSPPVPGSAALAQALPLSSTPPVDQLGRLRPTDGTATLGSVERDPALALLLPASGEAQVALTPMLAWNTPGQLYEIFVGTTPGNLTSAGVTTLGSFQLPALAPGTTYYWRVDVTEAGVTTPGQISSFVTRSPIMVTSLMDEDDPDPAEGDSISLREALAIAEIRPGPDRIVFDPSFSGATMTLSQPDVWLFVSSECEIDASDLPRGITLDLAGDRELQVRVPGEATFRNIAFTGASGILSDGAVACRGSLFLSGVTFHGNADGTVSNDGGRLLLDSCSFAGNAAAKGGALRQAYGIIRATNCTFSGNQAGEGGAIFSNGVCELTHCTVSGNSATRGGGLYVSGNGSILANSIIAGNISTDTSGRVDIFAASPSYITAQGSNLIGVNYGLETLFPAGPKVGTATAPLDARLTPLGDYGGMTSCRLPLPDSPAIDAAVALSSSPLVDQRALSRPIGTAADIGAVESFPAGTPAIDSDHDGMDDRLEVMWGFSVGPNEGAADTDGDGASNAEELESFTNLLDPADRLKIVTSPLTSSPLPGESPVMNVTWTSFPGLRYILEISDDLDFEDPDVRKIDAGAATGFHSSWLVPLRSGRDFVRVRTDQTAPGDGTP